MATEIGEHTARLNLYFFVLSREDVELDAVESRYPNFCVEELSLWHIIEKNVRDARYGIQDVLLVLPNGAFVNRLN